MYTRLENTVFKLEEVICATIISLTIYINLATGDKLKIVYQDLNKAKEDFDLLCKSLDTIKGKLPEADSTLVLTKNSKLINKLCSNNNPKEIHNTIKKEEM